MRVDVAIDILPTLRLVIHWANPRWRRLLTWAMRWHSPTVGRIPTLREAWTGRIYRVDPGAVRAVANAVLEAFSSASQQASAPARRDP